MKQQPKEKNWHAVSKSLLAERQKYRACLRDILAMEPDLCVCTDAYADRGLVDPSCQAHDWALDIKSMLQTYGVRLKHMDVQDVYFIEGQDTKAVKIGVAKDPLARLSELQTGSAEPLDLKAVVPGGGAKLEKKLHRQFRKSRLHGEWYGWTHELEKWIRGNARVL